jgi:hypothetical protein
MRKIVIALLAALVLGGAAYAQSGFFVAASAGYPGAAIHFGVEDVAVEGLDARLNVGYAYAGDFSVGLDALYGIDLGTMEMELPIDVYVGGGVGATFDGDFTIKALVGGSYGLSELGVEGLSVFLEAGPTYTFATDNFFSVDARLGVAYGF